jgi:hypothetical protein
MREARYWYSSEFVAFFSLIEPHLDYLRVAAREPDMYKEWEQLVRSTPGAVEKLARRRRLFEQWTVTSA